MIKDPSGWTTALRYGLQLFGIDYSLSVWTTALWGGLWPFGMDYGPSVWTTALGC